MKYIGIIFSILAIICGAYTLVKFNIVPVKLVKLDTIYIGNVDTINRCDSKGIIILPKEYKIIYNQKEKCYLVTFHFGGNYEHDEYLKLNEDVIDGHTFQCVSIAWENGEATRFTTKDRAAEIAMKHWGQILEDRAQNKHEKSYFIY